MKHTVYICIKAEIETNLDWEDAIDELGSQSDYDIGATENIKVLRTEWLATESQPEFNEL